ncbi:Uncharacterised protein [uncultured archaeon]|nr:Uncharacterised protein [uncultured archaeon]
MLNKSLFEEIVNFLNYLQINDFFPNKRDINKFIENQTDYNKKRKLDRIISLCREEGYLIVISRETEIISKRKNEVESKSYDTTKITTAGLKFLEEYEIKKRQENNTRTTLFLTSIIVLTTIVTFFNELGLIDKWVLMIVYLIFSMILLIYFKRAKVITI